MKTLRRCENWEKRLPTCGALKVKLSCWPDDISQHPRKRPRHGKAVKALLAGVNLWLWRFQSRWY